MKEKYLRRLDEGGSITNEDGVVVQMTLPRMSFEIENIEYDTSRKRNTMQNNLKHVPFVAVESQKRNVTHCHSLENIECNLWENKRYALFSCSFCLVVVYINFVYFHSVKLLLVTTCKLIFVHY